MVRLGGPFTSEDQEQVQDRYRLRQTFDVDPANPVLKLNYNVFLYDYQGYDELRFSVRLTDENGATITDFAQAGFGAGDDTSLKNTGWRGAAIDLSGYEGQQVHLLIDSGGTQDTNYGFWAYVDAGDAPTAAVATPVVTAPTNPQSGQPVPINLYPDPASGQLFIAIPRSQVAAFPEECLPLTLDVPIAAGDGTVSGVSLVSDPPLEGESAMTEISPGVWRAEIPCVADADLAVQYTLTEDGESETFIVSIGGIALIDPAGVVYDQARYDAAVAAGQSPDQARSGAAIAGAVVRLQRKQADGSFKNILSGDPGISTSGLNPEITAANGQFQWLTDAGGYRVVVSKDGYATVTSREISVPPEVTDLHVGMGPTTQPQPPDADGDGVADSADRCPNTAAATPDGCPPAAPPTGTTPIPPAPPKKLAPCANKKGKALAKCKRAQALKKAIAKCKSVNKGNKKAKKRALCIKREKALSKCSAITGKKKAKQKKQCVAAAKRIGRKKG